MALNTKLQTFVDVFDGDANKAADIAGISQQYGRLLMVSINSPSIRPKAIEVQEAIRQRQSTADLVIKGEIASREERQQFWTKNMRNESVSLAERRKNSELLGKSELDFGERRVNVDVSLADIAARVGSRRRQLASEASKAVEGTDSPAEQPNIEGKENE